MVAGKNTLKVFFFTSARTVSKYIKSRVILFTLTDKNLLLTKLKHLMPKTHMMIKIRSDIKRNNEN